MEIKFGNQVVAIEMLAAAARANNFPDILFFAAGKVATQGAKAKFRIKLSDGSSVIKKWNETVEYTDAGGTAFGNFFDGYLLKKDDIAGNFGIEFEVNTGSGYQKLDPVAADQNQIGSLVFQVITYDNGAGVTGAIGLAVMP
jgi:hypothetical protein